MATFLSKYPLFKSSPMNCRPIVRWECKEAYAREEIIRRLNELEKSGIGGVEVLPLHLLSSNGSASIAELSSKWMDISHHAALEAKSRNMSFEVILDGADLHANNGLRGLVQSMESAGKHPLHLPDIADYESILAILLVYPDERSDADIEVLYRGDEIPESFESSRDNAKLVFVIQSDARRYTCFSWAPEFPAVFRKKRKYDIVPYLAALFTDIGPITRFVRRDYYLTLSELTKVKHSICIEGPSSGMKLEQIKAQFDALFANGSSQIVMQDFVSWQYAKYLTDYLARMRYLNEVGKKVVDVAVVAPRYDTWGSTKDMNVNSDLLIDNQLADDIHREITAAGLKYDFVRDESLATSVSDGKFITIGAMTYSCIILPDVRAITPAAMHKIEKYWGCGGVIVALGGVPSESCSARRWVTESKEIVKTAKEVFGLNTRNKSLSGCNPAVVIPNREGMLEAYLSATIKPDVKIDPRDSNIVFTHHRLDDGDIYTLFNLSDQKKRAAVTLRAEGNVELLDPFTGDSLGGAVSEAVNNATRVHIEMEPFHTVVAWISPNATTQNLYYKTDSTELVSVLGPWKVCIPESSAQCVEKWMLSSWTEDDATKRYTGFGTYTGEFGVSEQLLNGEWRVILDLAEVHEIAEVTINDKLAGVIWKRPYRMDDITQFLKVGQNRITIRVINLTLDAMSSNNESIIDLQPGKLKAGLVGMVRLLKSRSSEE